MVHPIEKSRTGRANRSGCGRVRLTLAGWPSRAYAPQPAHILTGGLISSRAGAYDSLDISRFTEEIDGPVSPNDSPPATRPVVA